MLSGFLFLAVPGIYGQYTEVDHQKLFESYLQYQNILASYVENDEHGLWNERMDSINNSYALKWYQTDTGKSLLVSSGLMGLGLFTYKDSGFLNRIDVKDEINRYLPNFESPIDDFTQFVPYAAVYILPYLGLESKHDNWRKTTTMATALGLNLLFVQTMKYTISEERPDGSAKNSFPSGHTATAFMGAHIFHKEYAHESPYLSVAAYVLASMTGVMRQLNNRHWISDVFFGAGLGISLTELAYYINEKIYDDRHTNQVVPYEPKQDHSRPTYLGVKLGYASLFDQFLGGNGGIRAKDGYRWTFDGAYFFNKNFGLGAELGFQSFPIDIDDSITEEANSLGYELIPQAFGNRFYYVGPHAQFTWNKNYLGGNIYLGAVSGPKTEIFIRELDGPIEEEGIVYAEYQPDYSISWALGISYRRVLSNYLSVKLYADVNWADLDIKQTYLESVADGTPVYQPGIRSVTPVDSYSLGGSLIVNIW